MNKKIILYLVYIALILLGGVITYLKFYKPVSSAGHYQMSGNVTQVKFNLVTVSGLIQPPDGADPKKYTEITGRNFVVTPQTILKKIVLSRPKDFQPGKTYTPEQREEPGALTDIVAGTHIAKIVSKTDIFRNTTVAATEIYYHVFDFNK